MILKHLNVFKEKFKMKLLDIIVFIKMMLKLNLLRKLKPTRIEITKNQGRIIAKENKNNLKNI